MPTWRAARFWIWSPRANRRLRSCFFDLGASADSDIASVDMLKNLVVELDERAIDVLPAQVRGGVRDRLRKAGVMAELGENRTYRSVAAAVHDFEQRNQ